ncbi:growth hormone receptor-like isoform X2 [Brienomyrus brachyistius]|uniref:growth hormone receptor-like isoform X2 n=1 Tax=Brienomyrus brachyistius TaxID=42636 RepID=UPI0020B2D728|nr:growth hormone receptor-like isoform X2 [Brienomyrus brachyistius]
MSIGHPGVLKVAVMGVYTHPSLFFVLTLLSGLTWASTTPSVTTRGPHFTSCLSREQETFRCWWTAGNLQNLSQAGALRVFFLNKNVSPGGWNECPHYSSSECYFSSRYTSVWTSYCLQLLSASLNVTYDEICFNVEDIVFPEPPVGLNWTLLNVSRSGLHFDILLRWVPPLSADVSAGWMSLEYQTRYRERGSLNWHTLGIDSRTQKSIYGLSTGTEYEVQVRCRMVASENFGEFSNITLVTQSSSKGFALGVLLIFGAAGGSTILLLIVLSQHQRLAVLFLPPIPSPRIKGVDPDLLKNGKIDEVNSILHIHPHKANICNEDLLIDFLKLDLEEPNHRAEKCLVDPGKPAVPCRKDDLTQDSSFSSEQLRPQAALSSTAPPQPLSPFSSCQLSTASSRPLLAKQSCSPCCGTAAFYSQVGEVTSIGGVMLSTRQERKVEKEMRVTQPETPDSSTYTSEECARHISADSSTEGCKPSAKTSSLPVPPVSGYMML